MTTEDLSDLSYKAKAELYWRMYELAIGRVADERAAAVALQSRMDQLWALVEGCTKAPAHECPASKLRARIAELEAELAAMKAEQAADLDRAYRQLHQTEPAVHPAAPRDR